ncbi:MAG TPA: STAS domain-containing protein [Acidimicrobiia bacterium]|nr:STAS domain-containing protein [Acidimicrobiia bacterium]
MANIPILRLEGYVIVSIQDDLSDQEAEDLQKRLLESLAVRTAHGVLIDVSGLEIVDSYFCRILRDTAAMAQLMGVGTCVTGLAPAVAVTLTELGLDLSMVHTEGNLDRGLEWLRGRD